MEKGAAIGWDIGGGSTKVGLIGEGGQLLASRRLVLATDADFTAILADYRSAIAARGGDGLPVGIAYPGHVDRARGVGPNSNVPALDIHPLAAAPGGPVALLSWRASFHPDLFVLAAGYQPWASLSLTRSAGMPIPVRSRSSRQIAA